jgi:predicted secreted Zn-dependent protease
LGLLLACVGGALALGTPNAGHDAAPPAADPGPTPASGWDLTTSVHTTTYPVYGITANELRQYMDVHGPDCESAKHDGCTQWYIALSYRYRGKDGTCSVSEVHVSTQVTVTLPAWEPSEGTSQTLIDQWQAYMDALRMHEQGHVAIALASGEELLATLRALPSAPSCDALQARVSDITEGVLDECRAQHVAYDKQTDHGATQGARFP